jgi:hypothetical protein
MICVHQAFSVLSISHSIITSLAFPHRLTIFWAWQSKLQTLVGTLLLSLLFVKIGLGVRVKVNISWIIDKS